MTKPLILGTRSSALALWQARYVAGLCQQFLSADEIQLQTIDTHGDRDQSTALRDMGGFGVFTKAIQTALVDRTADVAVHSLKDLPTLHNEGTMLAAVPRRGPIGDAFISTKHPNFDALPQGATLGTSSLRRRSMVAYRRPDLKLVELRGNVETRLRKLDEQNLDAIILAEAGLVRLERTDAITEILDTEWMLPAVGQGAIGLECRSDDSVTLSQLQTINHSPTWCRVVAERAMLAALGGGCLVPIGVVSNITDNRLSLRGMVLNAEGTRRVVGTHDGPADTPLAVGQELAAKLLAEGAGELLKR